MLFALLNIFLVQAHVRMFANPGIDGAATRAIRNANSPTANGGFSVAGPCGGAASWGGASGSQYSDVSVGERVVLKINYNGGHRSPANEFAVRYKCADNAGDAGPTQAEMLAMDDLPPGSCNVLSCPQADQYPCNAANGNAFTAGYIFECTVPAESQGKDCTYSVLDQRDWGGCVDLRVGNAVATTTTGTETTQSVSPQQPVDPVLPQENVGTYRFASNNVNEFTPKYQSCCCTMDIVSDTHNKFVVSDTGVLTGTLRMTCPDAIKRWQEMSGTNTDLNLQMQWENNDQWGVTTQIMGQDMWLYVNGGVLYYENVDFGEPMICDGSINVNILVSNPVPYVADAGCADMTATLEEALFLSNASVLNYFTLGIIFAFFML